MRNILIIGAGKSASYLIKYFLDKAEAENLHITIGDINIKNARKLFRLQIKFSFRNNLAMICEELHKIRGLTC